MRLIEIELNILIDNYVISNESILVWLEKLEIGSAIPNKNLY